MERNTFNALLKDLIVHLYDRAAVENHPLTAMVNIPDEKIGLRCDYLQQIIKQAIDSLMPTERPLNQMAPEWRPYLILQKRYVEGISPSNLATFLAISERQLRRDHSRAMEALSNQLWEKLFPNQILHSSNQQSSPGSAWQEFSIQPTNLDLVEILRGVLNILENRAQSDHIKLVFLNNHPSRQPIISDRVVLRQIMFSLFNYAFQLQSAHQINISLEQEGDFARIRIWFNVDDNWSFLDASERPDLIDTVHDWSHNINLTLEEIHPNPGQAGEISLILLIPSPDRAPILVIDDQQPALRMYQRYLARAKFEVIGVDDPRQALETTREIMPALILLDVMMPNIDGWEILQALESDEKTRGIPVVVCSAWEASDLARSLGAARFLKKPITQRDLLDVLETLGLLQS
jgi:CheY-like chemotaxis protein